MNNRTRGVLAAMIGFFCGMIASYFVPGSAYVRGLVVAGIVAIVTAVILLVTVR